MGLPVRTRRVKFEECGYCYSASICFFFFKKEDVLVPVCKEHSEERFFYVEDMERMSLEDGKKFRVCRSVLSE